MRRTRASAERRYSSLFIADGFLLGLLVVSLFAVLRADEVVAPSSRTDAPLLRAGASAVDISPEKLPVRQNGGFLEVTADRILAPLYARALVLESGSERIAIAIVDSCMLPLTVCDEAKDLVRDGTGIPRDRILIAATHAHSAPSVMDYCLGSRSEPEYARTLPGKIARAIARAAERLAPAELGVSVVDASEYTACRRWIRRTDRVDLDPFGEATVRAMMHPGYDNPDYVGPSGPADPDLSIVSVRTADGRPIALLANYSMHYFGVSGGLSPDYFGLFAREIASRLAPGDESFVGILSQGTSGDLYWRDYEKRRDREIESYTREMVDLALGAYETIRHSRRVPLAMAERRVTIERRRPDAARLEWARRTWPDRSVRPRNQPEVYAEQAFFIDENPTEEVVLQALRIGELGVTAIPCEVYALTGLELKARSPLQPTMNIELANGASGYIPPPEQHALGGYNTWPARTAGLAVDAEPRIVEAVLGLLEKVSGEARREPRIVHGPYAAGILADDPLAYFRMEEFRGPRLEDASRNARSATVAPRAAFHLGGPEGAAFSGDRENRAAHLAGGHIALAELDPRSEHSIELWFWQGLRGPPRDVIGTLVDEGDAVVALLPLSAGEEAVLALGETRGETPIVPRTWHQLVLVRSPDRVSVFLDGQPELEIEGPGAGETKATAGTPPSILIGARRDEGGAPFEGKVDELSIYDRVLAPRDIARHYTLAGRRAAGEGRARDRTPADSAASPLAFESQPMAPEETVRATRIREGFRLELVAAEPLLADPVAIDWDAKGRLWVAEMADYPLGMDGEGQPGGRIRRLEDTDNDGRYDRSVVFADELSFPTGVLAWRRGALVTAAPDILYLADENDDGRADRREVLYTGFLPGNQQLRVNGLRFGLDNWIYCASGGHHAGYGADRRVRSIRTGEEILLGSRDLRIRPGEGAIVAESGPSQFGRVRDDYGDWFGVQNSRPLWHYVLSDRYVKRNPYVASPDPRFLIRGVSPRLYPAKTPQKRYHSFEDESRFTSACGPSIYRDDVLFEQDSTLHAFTCDPFHGIVQHALLERDGPTFVARVDTENEIGAPERRYDFFASTDRWCRPVMTRTGPDGALWIVDIYRYMIEHPEWLPESGREELRPFYRSGDDRGRIYRVVRDRTRGRRGNTVRAIPDLSLDSPAELVERLENPNGTVRDLAQRLLIDAKDRGVVPSLEAMVRNDTFPLARLHALATLDGLGALDAKTLRRALGDEDAGIVRHALVIAERFESSDEIVARAYELAGHTDARVRLELAHTLGEWRDERAGAVLAELAVGDFGDPWMRAAILGSAVPHQASLARELAHHGGEALRELLSPLLATALGTRETSVIADLLGSLVAAGGGRSTKSESDRFSGSSTPLASWQLDALAVFLDAIDRERTSLSALASGEPRIAALLDATRGALESAAAIAPDREQPLDLRIASTKLLGRRVETRKNDVDELYSLLASESSSDVQLAAVARLRTLDLDPRRILAPWARYLPVVRAALIDALLARPAWTRALLDAIESGDISGSSLSAAERARLTGHRDPQIAATARQVLELRENDDRERVLASLWPALRLNGFADRGREVFAARCASCHAFGGIGHDVGADLRGLTDRSGPALLEAIVRPNATVEPRFMAYSVVLRSGEVIEGIIAGETSTSLRLRTADGSERTVLRADVTTAESSVRSLMPEGLEADLTFRDVADLIAFLQEG